MVCVGLALPVRLLAAAACRVAMDAAQTVRKPGVQGAQGQRRDGAQPVRRKLRSEEHTSELQSLMRISYAVFCLEKKSKHSSPSVRACLVHMTNRQFETNL